MRSSEPGPEGQDGDQEREPGEGPQGQSGEGPQDRPGRRPATARHGGLDLRLLRAFVEVERFGSITEAAAALGYSQPGLSQRIQSLERRTGRRLFDRSAQGVSLTPEGVVLLPLARVMLAVDSEIRTALGRPDG
jgi:hypothetical protein